MLVYPKTKKVKQIDNYFGTKVSDHYRWLEDGNSKDTKKWVAQQNKLTFYYLKKIDYRNKIKKDVKRFLNYKRYSQPFKVGNYYFFYQNNGLQDQSVVYYQEGLRGKPKIFIDPNKMSKDGTVSVSLGTYSKDKKYITYTVSEAGSDWSTIRIVEIATKKTLPDKIQWVKAWGGAAWKGNGLYYSGYDAPKKGKELSQRNENQKVYYHKLGETQERDKLIFEDPKHPLRYIYAQTTQDEKFLIIYVTEGTHGYEVYVQDLNNRESKFMLIFKGFRNNYLALENVGNTLLFWTDNNAPNYRVISVDPEKPSPKNWQEIIPEQRDKLEEASCVGGKIIATYLKDAVSHVYQFDINGKAEREIELPGLGFATGFYGEREDEFTFYTFSSFNYPQTIFRYDLRTGKSILFKKVKLPFQIADFQVKEIFYKNHDGTRIPMFIVHKKGLKMNGQNPTYLYGYGGFAISVGPFFSPFVSLIINSGFVYAMPCIRGGGEYGEHWHKDGMLGKKQNVFNDFIAAAEYLIEHKYTSSKKIAIAGGSNGGLLVGACMIQRPDLFKVALPAVGVLDMLRFQKYTVGWGWVVEYGSSENKTQFNYLYKYSPLHNVKNGLNYPATFITTADHDDRVIPAHSFKFASALQEKHKGENPILIRIETKAGHGGSNALNKKIETFVDELAFTMKNLETSY